jgi:hypothetical protein
MSTKTTFKRIALVAVAALGFGTLSVAPSSASVNAESLYHSTPASIAANVYGDFSSTSTNILLTASAVIGVQHQFLASAAADAATVVVKMNTNNSYWNGTATVTNSALPVQTLGAHTPNNTGANVNATTLISVDGMTMTTTATAAGLAVGSVISTFTPTVAGTYNITLTSASEVFTWTVTAYATQAALDTANGVDNVASASTTTSFVNAGTANTGTADAVISAPATATTTAGAQTATILVTPKNAAGTAIVAKGIALTATVSGPGTLAISTTANKATTASVGRAITGAAEAFNVLLFADGTPGVATVTISAGTTVLATEKVTFYGAVASYTATVAKNVIPMATTTSGVIAVVAKDKDGNVVPAQTVTVKASDATVVADTTGTTSTAAEAVAGTATLGVTGIAAKFGKLTLTISNSAGTISTTAVVTLSSTTAAAAGVNLAFDKAEYTAGEKITLKVTAVDANGLPVAPMDPITLVPTANTSLVGFPSTWDSLTTDGSVSYTFYAPLVPGPIVITGTDSNSAAITASAAVISDGIAQAAVDAAAEAIDAANAATDAANAAAEAADAATAAAQDAADAVAALSVSVAAMIDALKKQITSLTNLVIKIQKKVKA